MENLVIGPTDSTPKIFFDVENNILEISGYSYPEDTSAFYQPVFDWLEAYLAQLSSTEITVNLDIVYFNSGSSKVLLDFFDLLNEETTVKNVTVEVNWYYEEEDMLEFGEEFQEDFKTLTFQFVKR
jgi:hypothetical protein